MRIHPQPRRGLVAAVVLVILVVVATVGATVVRMSLSQRSVVEAEERRAQVDWLVESGRRLGDEKLRADAAYAGETWKIPASDLLGRGNGEVVIVAERSGDAEPWRVRIAAEYPVGTPRSVRRTRTFIVQD